MPVEVTTQVPYGNAADVQVFSQGDLATVRFMPDPHGGPEAMWFCFRVRPTPGATARRLRLVLANLGNLLGGLDGTSVRPVVRLGDGQWHRLERGELLTLPDGRTEVAWELDAPQADLDVALCYPYGRPELGQLLHDTAGHWQADTIGVSQGGRPIVRLSNDVGRPADAAGEQRPGLYLLGRQHSGETPGSWVLDGFLRRLAELGPQAPLTWCVPLTNIDGIEQGDYGKDNFPWDLNRAWGVSPMRHEVLVMQRDMQRWRQRCRPALVMDFHAPGMCEQEGLYFFIPPPEEADAHAQALAWTAWLGQALGRTYALQGSCARVARYPSRWATPNATAYARHTLGVLGLSLESPYSSADAGRTLLTIEAYREAGAVLASAVAHRLADPEAWPASLADRG